MAKKETKHAIDVDTLIALAQTVSILQEVFPNDYDLGRATRKAIIESKKYNIEKNNYPGPTKL